MKTKLILHGGTNPDKKQENDSGFYKEILKNTPEKTKILIVPFAKDADRIPDSIIRVKAEFNKEKWQKELNFEVADEKSFIEQIKSVDVIYIQGGVSLNLLNTLKKFPNFKESLRGKIVAGTSAGANVFGKIFYSPIADNTFEGLGILPIKIIPHYSEKYKDVFKNVEQDLETLLLSEYEYKIFEI